MVVRFYESVIRIRQLSRCGRMARQGWCRLLVLHVDIGQAKFVFHFPCLTWCYRKPTDELTDLTALIYDVSLEISESVTMLVTTSQQSGGCGKSSNTCRLGEYWPYTIRHPLMAGRALRLPNVDQGLFKLCHSCGGFILEYIYIIWQRTLLLWLYTLEYHWPNCSGFLS